MANDQYAVRQIDERRNTDRGHELGNRALSFNEPRNTGVCGGGLDSYAIVLLITVITLFRCYGPIWVLEAVMPHVAAEEQY